MLSRDDIQLALAEGHLKILPFESKNLTGIGYNLSTTDFAFSIKKGVLLTIHKEGLTRYVTIPSNDSVLFFSKEYIELDNTLAGTFHSKVSRVSEGLGHNSTTLDATWKGQLLISVNNPTSKGIKFYLDKDGRSILTLLLHKLDTPVTGDNIHDNNKGRCELLIAHFAAPLPYQAYKEKHLELRDYVEKELANSLNGDDNFLDPDQPRDEYSFRIERLTRLRDRFINDRTILQEDRYILGKEGRYFYLKDNDEYDLINGCSLFPLKAGLRGIMESNGSQSVGKEHLKDAIPIISQFVDVINFELDMIDHTRRIRWQNDRAAGFANEDSELVKMRRKKEKTKQRGRALVLFIAIIAVIAIIWRISPDTASKAVALATLCGAVLATVVQRWFQHWGK